MVVLIASEGDLKLAQELIGHKSITTQRYTHLSNSQLAEQEEAYIAELRAHIPPAYPPTSCN